MQGPSDRNNTAYPKPKGKRAQSAIEYLTTYGWSLIIIAIVVGAIYYFTFLPGATVQSQCQIASGLSCDDIVLGTNSISGGSTIVLFMTNSQQYAILNPTVTASVNGQNATSTCLTKYVIGGGTIICTVSIPAKASTGQLLTGKLYVQAQYCGLSTSPLNSSICSTIPAQVYSGTFSAHSSGTSTALLSPSFSISVSAASAASPISSRDAITATVSMLGNKLKGATVNFTLNNSLAYMSQVSATTNPAGNATSYLVGNQTGTVKVTARFSGVSANVTVQLTPATTASSTISIPGPTVNNTQTNITSAALSASPTVIDNGQKTTLTVTWAGGVSPYSVTVYSTSSSTCSSSLRPIKSYSSQGASPVVYQYNASSSSYYCAKVTDAVGNTRLSTVAYVTVHPALSISTSAAPTAIDYGSSYTPTSTTVTASWGSTGTNSQMYVIFYYSGSSSGCMQSGQNTYILGKWANGTTSTSITLQPTAGTYYYCVYAVDGASATAWSSPSSAVNVAPQLTAGMAASPATIYTGQSTTLTTSWSGGTSFNYSNYRSYQVIMYQVPSATSSCASSSGLWSYGTSPYLSGSSTSTSVSLNSTGVYYYCSLVFDAINNHVATSVVQVNVNPPPTSLNASLSLNRSTIDIGQSVSLTASWSGQNISAPYKLIFYYGSSSSSCPTTIANYNVSSSPSSRTFTPSSTGTYYFCLFVLSNSGATTTANAGPLTVNTQPSSVTSPATYVLDLGQSQTFGTSTSGGTSPYYGYGWSEKAPGSSSYGFPGDCINGYSGSTCVFKPSGTTGTYYIKRSIADSAGVVINSTPATITVNPALTAPSLSSSTSLLNLASNSTPTLAASWSGGTPPYTVKWYNTGSCSGTPFTTTSTSSTSASVTAYPLSSQITTTYCASVTDSPSSPATTNSGTVNVSIISLYPLPISSESCVYSSGYVYCVGGMYTNSSPYATNRVYSAPVNHGAVGPWTATTSYPMNISDQSCIFSGGYIYCVGGYNSSTDPVNKVYYAPASGGTVSAWRATNNYPISAAGISCVTYSGYIYCIGGSNGAGDYANVYQAPLTASDTGTTWSSSSNFDFAVSWPSCVVTLPYGFGGYPQLICVGGMHGGSPDPYNYIAGLLNNGVLSSWSHYSNYPESAAGVSCVMTTDAADPTCIGAGNNGQAFDSAVYTCDVVGCNSSSWTTSYWTTNTYLYPTQVAYSSCVQDGSAYTYCIGGAKGTYFDNVIHTSSDAGYVPWN